MNCLALKKTTTLQLCLVRILSFAVFLASLHGSSVIAQTSQVTSEFHVKTDTQSGVLAVKLAVPDGWHCFSTTQLPGGPMKSKITVAGTGIKVTGDFVPLEPPVPHEVEGFDVACEQHEGVVTWQAPVEFDASIDPAKAELSVKYRGQICMNEPPGACQQVNEKITASFKGFVKELTVPAADQALGKKNGTPKKLELEPYQPDGTHVTFTGSIWTDDGKQNFKPGDEVTLEVNAVPLEGFHFYAYETTEPRNYMPTLISFKRPKDWQINGPQVSIVPEDHNGIFEHHQPTTWTFKVKIPPDAAPDQAVAFTGGIQVMTCKLGCDRPSDSSFTVAVPMGTDSAAALKFAPAKMGSVAAAVKAGHFADEKTSTPMASPAEPQIQVEQAIEVKPKELKAK